MKKIGLKLLPIVSISIFIIIMTTGSFLKKPLFGNDGVIDHIDLVTEYVKEEDWEAASIEIEYARQAWRNVVLRIQFSSERNEINAIKLNLERADGFIKAKHLGGALSELSELRFIWDELGR